MNHGKNNVNSSLFVVCMQLFNPKDNLNYSKVRCILPQYSPLILVNVKK